MQNYQKTILCGIGAILIVVLFAHYLIGNPVTGLMLLKWGKVTKGHIVQTDQDYEHNESGSHASYSVQYEYNIDGQYFKKRYIRSGKLKPTLESLEKPYPVEIEYFPKYPAISRLKGNGAQSFIEWFFREFCLGLFVYGLFLIPGIFLINDGWKDKKREEVKRI
ncbi:MAG: hypothetical protein Q7J67_05655 [bacterium]|nr:hypothetical protein [bacterium]